MKWSKLSVISIWHHTYDTLRSVQRECRGYIQPHAVTRAVNVTCWRASPKPTPETETASIIFPSSSWPFNAKHAVAAWLSVSRNATQCKLNSKGKQNSWTSGVNLFCLRACKANVHEVPFAMANLHRTTDLLVHLFRFCRPPPQLDRKQLPVVAGLLLPEPQLNFKPTALCFWSFSVVSPLPSCLADPHTIHWNWYNPWGPSRTHSYSGWGNTLR